MAVWILKCVCSRRKWKWIEEVPGGIPHVEVCPNCGAECLSPRLVRRKGD